MLYKKKNQQIKEKNKQLGHKIFSRWICLLIITRVFKYEK